MKLHDMHCNLISGGRMQIRKEFRNGEPMFKAGILTTAGYYSMLEDDDTGYEVIFYTMGQAIDGLRLDKAWGNGAISIVIDDKHNSALITIVKGLSWVTVTKCAGGVA